MKKKGTKLLNDHVLSFFQRSPLKKFNFRQVLNHLPYEVNKNNIKECLCLLEEKKQIKQIKPGSYMLFSNRKTFTGVLVLIQCWRNSYDLQETKCYCQFCKIVPSITNMFSYTYYK